MKFLVLQIVILQFLAVSVFGGQGWKHIPEIPAGRRAQYLLLKKDGGYKYGYDTGKGSSAFQSASGANEVTGNYAYTGGDGLQQEIQYTSGVGGFVPKLSSLGKGTGSSVTTSSGSSTVSKPSYGSSQVASGATDESSGDSSYNYAFDTGNFQQQEVSDAAHNVAGTYQYTTDDGQHTVQYHASPGTGYVANVDGVQYPGKPVDGGTTQTSQGFLDYQVTQPVFLPQVSVHATDDSQQETIVPYVPGQDESSGDASYSFSYSSDAHRRDESSDSQGNVQGFYSYVDPTGTQQQIDYQAGDKTGFVVTKSTLDATSAFSKAAVQHSVAGIPVGKPQPNYIPAPSQTAYGGDESGPSDASYNFGYQAKDHSRQESSDQKGNVKGSYSFVAKDDGLTRTVNYIAGADTGFVASGAHLPGTGPSQASSGIPPLTKTSPAQSQIPQQHYIPSVPIAKGVPPVSAPETSDGSYSFSYDAGDHSRTETADQSGNVHGSYSFVTKDDGVTRKVDYTAGSATGFVANVSPVQTAPVQPALVKTPVSYKPVPPALPQSSYIPSIPSTGGTDGSYSFGYEAGDHSRTETGDASGNVVGSYSFTAIDDGLQRKVDYVAGANTGFLATGTHLPTPVPVVHAPLTPAAPSGFAKTPSFRPQAVPHTHPVFPPSGSGIESGGGTDGSYSFTYDAGDHSRTETGDSHGNVKGRYSFVAKDDGLSRTVEYSAGSETGFIAAGAHLPSAVTANQASAAPTFTKTSIPSASDAGVYQASVGSQDEASGDASYSYSYETDSSSKQETSDSQGNVAGSFTYLGGDGIARTLQYTSKGDEGFIAVGDHLPKPGAVVPSSAAGKTAFGIKSHQSSGTGAGYNFNSNSYTNTKSLVQTKNAITGGSKTSDYVVHTYLPPDSEKFGYIYDTTGH